MPIPALLRHKPRDFSLCQWQESGLWTGDFEPVQHKLDAWESRAERRLWQRLKMARNKFGYTPIRK
jgi:hypothetical protein